VLIAECTEARRVQYEERHRSKFESEPPSPEDAQEMPARKDQLIAFYLAHPTNYPIGSRTHLEWGLASETARRGIVATLAASSGSLRCVEIVFFDEAVEVDVSKALAGIGAPVAQQPGLRVFRSKRVPQQGVFL
jgi:hypothetical protein